MFKACSYVKTYLCFSHYTFEVLYQSKNKTQVLCHYELYDMKGMTVASDVTAKARFQLENSLIQT